jgi:hypothetical protein
MSRKLAAYRRQNQLDLALQELCGGWSVQVEDPAHVSDAIIRSRRQTENGRAGLLEFVTSQEQNFLHRRDAAE